MFLKLSANLIEILSSGKLHSIMGEHIEKPDFLLFEEDYCDIKLERAVTLEPERSHTLPLLVVPALPSNSNTMFDVSPAIKSELYTIITPHQRSNASGCILLRVRNLTCNKVRLPKGMYFGLVKRLDEEGELETGLDVDQQQLTMSGRSPLVDIERLRFQLTTDESAEDSMEDVEDSSVPETAEVTSNDRTELLGIVETNDNIPVAGLENVGVDLEFLSSDVEILKELSAQLTSAQAPDIQPESWEELNPTFSSFNIQLDGLDTDLPLDEPGLPLFDDLQQVHRGSEGQSPDFQDKPTHSLDIETKSLDVELGETEERKEYVKDVESVSEDKFDLTDMAPIKVTNKIARKREPFNLEEEKPLVVQLKTIREKIENNSAEGDLSDQFPSLIGQEEYLALYETLIRYTGCQLQDIDYDIIDFGEKMYSELSNFGVDTLQELLVEVKKLHETSKDGNLQDWIKIFSERFEALRGINDLNGEHFDSMIVQLILLHFCDQLPTNDLEVNPKVRDMIGYPSFDGFDIVEEEISLDPSDQVILDHEKPRAGVSILEMVEAAPVDLVKSSNLPEVSEPCENALSDKLFTDQMVIDGNDIATLNVSSLDNSEELTAEEAIVEEPENCGTKQPYTGVSNQLQPIIAEDIGYKDDPKNDVSDSIRLCGDEVLPVKEPSPDQPGGLIHRPVDINLKPSQSAIQDPGYTGNVQCIVSKLSQSPITSKDQAVVSDNSSNTDSLPVNFSEIEETTKNRQRLTSTSKILGKKRSLHQRGCHLH